MDTAKSIQEQLPTSPAASFLSSASSTSSPLSMLQTWQDSLTQLYETLTSPSLENQGSSLMLPAPLSNGLDILQLLQNTESLLTTLKSQGGILTPAEKGVQDQLGEMFQNVLTEKPPVSDPLQSFLTEQSGSYAAPPATPSPDNTEKTQANLKELLLKLKTIVEEHLDQEQTASGVSTAKNTSETAASLSLKDSAPLQQMEKAIQNALDMITQQQVLSLPVSSETSASQALSLHWVDQNGNPSEVQIWFEEQSSSGQKSEKRKAFRAYFSMDLSKLGPFEINLTEINKNMEITFYSENPRVMKFFQENASVLTQNLQKSGIQSVIVKTANQKTKPPSSSKDTSYFLQFPYIDITV